MNWGKGIIIGMALFMVFIITMVVIMMQQKIDLVSEDYYQKEISYNNEYDAHNAYQNSKDSIQIACQKGYLIIQLGKDFQSDSVKISLRRPNNQLQDLDFQLLAKAVIALPIDQLPKGMFDCIVEGKIKGENYRFERSLYIQ